MWHRPGRAPADLDRNSREPRWGGDHRLSCRLRYLEKLPPILGVPLSRLFTAEALDYRYQDNHHCFDRPQRKSRKAISL